ncbi:MAG TPA: dTMP kinase [Terriglobales bacterium]
MPPRRGRFITFEGLDGTGKSTQLALLADHLQKKGFEVVATRNPGGTPIGERIRSILLDSRTSGLSALAEMALMFADRAQHVEQVILPALAQGKFVLCDRYTDSSEAYQGYGRGLGSETVLAMHKLLCRDLWPELTIILQFGLESSLARARSRNQRKIEAEQQDENRFEREDQDFYARVAHGFAEIAKRDANRVVVIDATGLIESSHQQIVRALEERFPEIAISPQPRTAGVKK